MNWHWCLSIGLGAAIGLAMTPPPADAMTTQRVDLASHRTVKTETRWQPTGQTETVVEPWQPAGTSTEVRQSPEGPSAIRYQQVRVQQYRRRTLSFPLEAKQIRTHAATTRSYELRTADVRHVCQQVTATRSVETGRWISIVKKVPVMVTVWRTVQTPKLTVQAQRIYRNVTTVTRTPGGPIKTGLTTTVNRAEPYSVYLKRYRTVTRDVTTRQLYDGPLYDTNGTNKDKLVGHLKVTGYSDSDFTLAFSGSDLVGPGSLYLNADQAQEVVAQSMGRTQPRPATEDFTWAGSPQGYGWIRYGADHDEVVMRTHRGGWPFYRWEWTSVFRLDGHVASTTTRQVTYMEPYLVSETRYRIQAQPVNISIQGEHLVNQPKELGVADLRGGVYWGHYHYPGIKCPYESPPFTFAWNNRYFPGLFWGHRGGAAVLRMSTAGKPAGNVINRVMAQSPEVRGSFTYVSHHTDVMPSFTDDVAPPKVTVQTHRLFDHTEYRYVWITENRLVAEQKPLMHVVRWDLFPPNCGSYRHRHDDPSTLCEDRYIKGRAGGEVIHTAHPVFGPATEPQVGQEWATYSTIVSEPKTILATVSVVLDTTPGEEVLQTDTPWLSCGETRRAGDGSTCEATCSTSTVLSTWHQVTVPVAIAAPAAAPIKTAAYMSDFHGGGNASPQRLSGKQLRLTLKSEQAKPSRAHVAPPPQARAILSLEPPVSRVPAQPQRPRHKAAEPRDLEVKQAKRHAKRERPKQPSRLERLLGLDRDR